MSPAGQQTLSARLRGKRSLLFLALHDTRGSKTVTPPGLPASCKAEQPWLTNEPHARHMDWGGGQVSGEHLVDINTCRVLTKA